MMATAVAPPLHGGQPTLAYLTFRANLQRLHVQTWNGLQQLTGCHDTAVFMRTGEQGKNNRLQAPPPYLQV